ncbi:MAG TPA: DUF4129 domain-containing protein [Rhizomicrobium sp.]
MAAHTAPIPSSMVRAHEALLARSDLQFDFKPLPHLAPPDWLAALVKFLTPLAPYLRDAFWAALCVCLLLLFHFGARATWRRFHSHSKHVAPPPSLPDWRPAPQAARLLLLEADTLAARGQFGEAAHLLLLRGIEDIVERRPMLVKQALTSREIAALEQLPTAPRTAFARIAQVVERALFAGHTIGADDFARCRLAYEHFALPGGWSAEPAT